MNRRRSRQSVVAGFMATVAGLLAVWGLGEFLSPPAWSWAGLVLTGAVVAFEPTRRRAAAASLGFSRWGRRHPAVLAIVAGCMAAAVLLVVGLFHGRALTPQWHDEFSYATHAQIVATGRLWMPPHPLMDALASFYLVTDPVYVPIYFPGTAIVHAPGARLGVPFWVTSLLLSGLSAGLLCRIVTRLTDPIGGLLSVFLLLSVPWYRLLSLMILSQTVVLVLGLALVGVWMRWDRHPSARWAAALGGLAGGLAITRPVDAVALVLPVVVVIGVGAWRRLGWTGFARTVGVAVLAASPWLALQGVLNHAVTGSMTGYPHAAWVAENYPDAGFGFGPVTDRVSSSPTPQIRRYYETDVAQQVRAHRGGGWWGAMSGDRVVRSLSAWTASPWLLLPLVLGLVSRRPRLWVFAASIGLFFGLYGYSPFYLSYYPIVVTHLTTLLIVVGTCRAARRFLGLQRRHGWSLIMGVAAFAFAGWPFANPAIRGDPLASLFGEITHLNAWEKNQAALPALVFFRDGGGVPDVEPVYNASVAWPDEAKVVRVHDRGVGNLKVLRYFAQKQPERHVYLIDRGDGKLYTLGPVTQAYAELREAVDAARGASGPR